MPVSGFAGHPARGGSSWGTAATKLYHGALHQNPHGAYSNDKQLL